MILTPSRSDHDGDVFLGDGEKYEEDWNEKMQSQHEHHEEGSQEEVVEECRHCCASALINSKY